MPYWSFRSFCLHFAFKIKISKVLMTLKSDGKVPDYGPSGSHQRGARMKDSFWLSLLLVGVAAGLPSAPSMAAWSTGTVRADPWVVRFGLEGQRLYGRRFEFQVTRRLRGGGDDEPSFPVDEANLAASGAGEGGFVERLKGSLARLMCMMPQEQDGRRSSAPTSAASAESEEDEREHIRFAAVAAEAVWLSREAVALAAAARKANEASVAKAEVCVPPVMETGTTP
jgi:hypothetical protein